MNTEEITKAILEGQLTPETLTALENSLSEAGKAELKKAQAFVAKRRDEEAKLGQPSQKKDDQGEGNGADTTARFREETIQSAKSRLFSEFAVPSERQAEYDEAFKRLDSGKMTLENIYEDFKGVHAFLNRDTLLTAKQEQERMEAEAASRAAASAGSPGGSPSGQQTHDEKVVEKFAQENGVPVDVAKRVLTEGTTRLL